MASYRDLSTKDYLNLVGGANSNKTPGESCNRQGNAISAFMPVTAFDDSFQMSKMKLEKFLIG